MAIASQEALENALHAAVVTASGKSASTISWEGQENVRGAGPWISLGLDGPAKVGQDVVEQSFDESADAHEEIENRVSGLREATLTITVFGADAAGNNSPMALASYIANGLSMPGVRYALNVAGIGVRDVGRVLKIGANRRAGFEARAILDVIIYYTETRSENLGYFSSATLEDLDTEDTITVP